MQGHFAFHPSILSALGIRAPGPETRYTGNDVSATIVVIGPEPTLPTLRARFESGGRVHSFTDSEAIEALEHIFKHRPRIVAVEREFSGTSRGAALIGRVKDDPALAECEVRVVAHDASPRPSGVRRPGAPGVPEAATKPAQQGIRRAARVRIADGIEVLVDGDPADAGRSLGARRSGAGAHSP